MSKLHVSARELKKGFHALRQAIEDQDTTGPSRPDVDALLLGIYALECGLKLLLLQRRGMYSTSALDGDDAFFTHDLNHLLTEAGERARFRMETAEKPVGTPVAPRQLHELYRYGGRLSQAAERQLTATLVDLFRFIEENAR